MFLIREQTSLHKRRKVFRQKTTITHEMNYQYEMQISLHNLLFEEESSSSN